MNIEDIPYEPQARPEHIETARLFLTTDMAPPTAPYGVGNYRVVYDKSHTDFIGKPCHAGLGSAPPYSLVRRCVALHTGNDEFSSLYRKWLWEESFASRFVLSIEENGAIVSADIPAILMQNIAIMSRHCREFTPPTNPGFPIFNALYPLVGGDLAYVLAFTTQPLAPDLEQAWNSPVLNGGASHRAWPLFQLKSLKNFLTGEFHIPDTKLNEPWRTHGGLYGGAKLCQVEHDYSTTYRSFVQDALAYDDIREELSVYRKSTTQGEMYRPPNPFARKPSSYTIRLNDATLREVVDVIIPALKKKELIP